MAVMKAEVTWDDDAQVWTVVSADVPGLVAEAETIELLLLKLQGLVPELFALNGIESGVPAETVLAELRARLEARRQELQGKHRPASA